jgi:hypothetical protein
VVVAFLLKFSTLTGFASIHDLTDLSLVLSCELIDVPELGEIKKY